MQYDDHLAIDRLCDRFEQELRAGQNPDLVDFVNQSGIDSDILVENLIRVHADYSLKSSNKLDVQNYEKLGNRFVEFAKQLASDSIGRLDVSNSLDLNLSNPQIETNENAIGPYQLIEKLGEGGMGTVWKAQQSEPVRREVALKVIKTGVDSKEVLRRFDAERQALAIMNHPNIARIVDAGTTADGKPYFAMELVDGQPITIYCDQNKLNIEQRLKLFVQACHGIQHAHQKGIIHRDLKPSNVLVANVDGKPVPKIIDFGLAKATENAQRLTDESLYTGIGQVMGTVKYMSPEQASLNSIDIDTRTDIYSLGVILYELLAGTTALDSKSIKDQSLLHILEAIREVEPYWPSKKLIAFSDEVLFNIATKRNTKGKSLIRNISGDLDWIVMKSLEKDRSRRYESAYGLSADIDRYLNAEPIVARKISRFDRALRWGKRKPLQAGFLGVSVLAALLIVITFVGVRYQNELARLNSSLKQKNIDLDQSLLNEASARARAENSNNELTKTNELLDAANLDLTKTNKQLEIAKTNEETAKQQLETAIDFQRYQMAYDLWHKGDLASAAAIFNACKNRAGAWDWDYLNKTILNSTIESISAPLIPNRIKYSPSGQWLAFSYPGRIEFRNAKDNAFQFSLPLNNLQLRDFAFDTNEEYFAASGVEGLIVWDLKTKKQIYRPKELEKLISAIEFIPGESKLFCGGNDGLIFTFDITRGKSDIFFQTNQRQIYDLILDETQSKLVYCGSDSTQSIDLKNNAVTQTFKLENWGYTDHQAIEIPELKMLVTCGYGPVNFWDFSTGELIESKTKIAGKSLSVRAAALNKRQNQLALAGNDGQIHIYSIPNRAYLHSIKVNTAWINDISYSPLNFVLASASNNQKIDIWNTEHPTQFRIVGKEKFSIRGFSISDCCGLILVIGTDQKKATKYYESAYILNVDGSLEWECKSEDKTFVSANWDKTSSRICLVEVPRKSSDRTNKYLKVLDLPSGDVLCSVENAKQGVFSKKPDLIWLLEERNSLKLINCTNAKTLTKTILNEFNNPIKEFQISLDEKYLIAFSHRRACCYSIDDSNHLHLIRLFELPLDKHYSAVSLSPSNYVVLCSASTSSAFAKAPQIFVYDINSNAGDYLPILSNYTTNVSFEPNGRTIMTSHHRLMPTIWNLKNGYRTITLQIDNDNIISQAKFSLDSRYVIGTDENKIYIWDKQNFDLSEKQIRTNSVHKDSEASESQFKDF